MVGFGEFHPALPRTSQPLDGLAARIPWDPEPGFAQKLAELSVGECATSTWRLLWLVVGLRRM